MKHTTKYIVSIVSILLLSTVMLHTQRRGRGRGRGGRSSGRTSRGRQISGAKRDRQVSARHSGRSGRQISGARRTAVTRQAAARRVASQRIIGHPSGRGQEGAVAGTRRAVSKKRRKGRKRNRWKHDGRKSRHHRHRYYHYPYYDDYFYGPSIYLGSPLIYNDYYNYNVDSRGLTYWEVSNHTNFNIRISTGYPLIKTIRSGESYVNVPRGHDFNYVITTDYGYQINEIARSHYLDVYQKGNRIRVRTRD